MSELTFLDCRIAHYNMWKQLSGDTNRLKAKDLNSLGHFTKIIGHKLVCSAITKVWAEKSEYADDKFRYCKRVLGELEKEVKDDPSLKEKLDIPSK